MNRRISLIIGLLVLLLFIAYSMSYTVKYNEVAIKATFGKANENSIIREPGLHFRLPVFIDKVEKLDTRLQLVMTPKEEITTSDGLQIVVSAFMFWRVDETGDRPLTFFKSLRRVEDATSKLRSQFTTELTGQLSQYPFDALIGEESQLLEVEEGIRVALAEKFVEYGVTPDTVGINQIVLPPKSSKAVLERMQATRNILAEVERSAGKSAAENITSDAKTQVGKIRAFANQRAEEIRAEGEIQAAAYLKQMSADEDLAIFLVWLDTLQQALNERTTLILPSTLAPFHLMTPENTVDQGGIPMPAGLDEDPAVEGGA